LKAIIIAAGVGSRLGELTKELPKPLVDVNGKSIIERQISLFKKNGINDIIIVTGHQKEKFHFENVEYVYNSLYKEGEQASSLMAAKQKIVGDVIISFGDIIFDESILHQILTSKNDLVIGVDLDWNKSYEKRIDNSPIMSDFVAIKNGSIMILFRSLKEFNEEYKIAEFIGLMKLSVEGSKIITEKLTTLEKNHMGKFHDAISFKKAKIIDLLQELHESKIKIEPINVKGKWCEIDTIQDLEIARRMFN